MTTSRTLIAASRFTAADRCDRCGARATTRVVLSGGTDLVFCGHHSRRYDEALRAVAVEVVTSG